MTEKWRSVSKRQIAMLFLCSFVPWSFGYGAVPLLPVYATRLGAGPAVAGYYLAAAYVAIALGSATSSWIARRFRSCRTPLILAGLTGIPVSWGMGHVSSLWALTVLTGLMWYFGGLGLSRYMTATAPLENWDAAPDGSRFVFVELDQSESAGNRIDVALHWGQHLETPKGP